MGKFRCTYEVQVHRTLPPTYERTVSHHRGATPGTLLTQRTLPMLPAQDTGDDILCVFPQGGVSDKSAWELDSLATMMDKERGMNPLPAVCLQPRKSPRVVVVVDDDDVVVVVVASVSSTGDAAGHVPSLFHAPPRTGQCVARKLDPRAVWQCHSCSQPSSSASPPHRSSHSRPLCS